MADDSLEKEIEELRSQVAELKAERQTTEQENAQESGKQKPTGKPTPQAAETNELIEAEGDLAEPEEADLKRQFQELFDAIDEELKAANPLTVLVVFALGVLMGRLLPR
jgi:hypothetical protein